MCLSFYFFSNPRVLPPTTALSLACRINHQKISRNPPPSSLSIVIFKVRCKTAIPWSICSVCWGFASWHCRQFGSVKLINVLTALDISYIDNVSLWSSAGGGRLDFVVRASASTWGVSLLPLAPSASQTSLSPRLFPQRPRIIFFSSNPFQTSSSQGIFREETCKCIGGLAHYWHSFSDLENVRPPHLTVSFQNSSPSGSSENRKDVRTFILAAYFNRKCEITSTFSNRGKAYALCYMCYSTPFQWDIVQLLKTYLPLQTGKIG